MHELSLSNPISAPKMSDLKEERRAQMPKYQMPKPIPGKRTLLSSLTRDSFGDGVESGKRRWRWR